MIEAYERLGVETVPPRIAEAGDNLMRAIFGNAAFAEDSANEDRLDHAYDRFMHATDEASKATAGKELIRSIFGNDAIAD